MELWEDTMYCSYGGGPFIHNICSYMLTFYICFTLYHNTQLHLFHVYTKFVISVALLSCVHAHFHVDIHMIGVQLR